jgi:ketosteroid isomerase-like protein
VCQSRVGRYCRGVASGNTERVRRAYAGGVDDFLALMHPDAEWHWPPGMADSGIFRGKEEIRRGVDTWTEPWGEFQMEPVELLERGEDVLAVVRYRARGRASGMEIDEHVAHLWEFREDLAVRMRMFGDVRKAKRRFTEGG